MLGKAAQARCQNASQFCAHAIQEMPMLLQGTPHALCSGQEGATVIPPARRGICCTPSLRAWWR